MSCYFRYLNDVLAEAGVTVTPANKRQLDRAVHRAVGVPYKHCMPARGKKAGAGGPDCWSQVKVALQQPATRAALVAALQRAR